MAIATTDPATGETLLTWAPLDATELEAKVARAADAFRRYRATSFAERGEWLRRAADWFAEERARLARLMAREMGKPVAQGEAEIDKCALACRHYAERAEALLTDLPVPDAAGRCHVRFEPLGPVLAMMPWNFPFWQVVRFAAPALMAGNVALLKHAENVPQCARALEDIFREAGFPEGCFQNLAVTVAAIPGLLADPRVAAASLTGSVAAGRAVAAEAGRHLKRCVLELGGSDPFVVLPSAPLEETVAQAAKARLQNSGQSCIAAKRFIVHAAIYDPFAERFAAAFRAARMGDPFDPATEVGPLCRARALETLEDQVGRAVAAGAKVLAGGRRGPGPGFFFEPTILAGLDPAVPVAREEFFGPVALLFRACDFDHALELANGTSFGLGASLWTRDEAEQRRGVRELAAGQVFLNGMVVSQPALPFGGIKESGYGRELGVLGIREFVNAKSVWTPA